MIKLSIISVLLTCVVSFASLIGYYNFEGNANDVSGYGHHGIVNGATQTIGYNGSLNGAYYFHGGTSNNIYFGNPALYYGINNRFSISVLVKLTGEGILLEKDVIGTFTNDWNIYVSPHDFRFVFGTYEKKLAPAGILDDTWHMLTFVRDIGTGNFKLYLNGELRIALGNSYTQCINQAGLRLGAWDTPTGVRRGINGSIDELKIFDHALSDEDVSVLYKEYDLNAAVPEPATMLLFIVGLLILLIRKRN